MVYTLGSQVEEDRRFSKDTQQVETKFLWYPFKVGELYLIWPNIYK